MRLLPKNIPLVRKRIALLFIFFVAVFLIIFFSKSTPTSQLDEHGIRLETHTTESDSDGDGVPDWLEDITESDPLNASSFPYHKDIALTKNITVNELLYGGPGEFTEDIVMRFLLGDIDGSEVSPEEKDQFVDISTDYFLKQVERRGLPRVHLNIDNTVSREMVLSEFLLALQSFSKEKQPIGDLVFEIFAKNTAVSPDTKRVQAACDFTLKTIPRNVPNDVYESYYLILERITYLCEALDVAVASNTAENYFYAIKLLTTGKMFQHIQDPTTEGARNAFINIALSVVNSLQSGVSSEN